MTSGADWTHAARLTDPEFQACWAALELGDPPVQLGLRPTGATEDGQRRDHHDGLAALAGRGLAGPDGPCAPLAGALRLLARAPVGCDLRLAAPGTQLVALGAADREHGVVLSRREGELRVLPMSGPQVPITLVELIGPLNPARARPVNIPAELLDRAVGGAAADAPWAVADRLVALGVTSADASSLARMCTEVTAVGQLGATARNERGRPRRGRWVVGFHRGRDGDCLQLRRPTAPGRPDTVTIAPATAQKLHAQLSELISDTHPAR
jgi:hypothetical protein